MLDLKTWFRENLGKYLTVIKTEIADVRRSVGEVVATDQEFSAGTATSKSPSVKQVKEMAPKRFNFTQTVPAATWVVNHNLGVRPSSVSVLSVGGLEVLAEVLHVSDNQVLVLFDEPARGSVICM